MLAESSGHLIVFSKQATSPGIRPLPSSYLLSFEVDQRKPLATS